jgi:hypothetical protein
MLSSSTRSDLRTGPAHRGYAVKAAVPILETTMPAHKGCKLLPPMISTRDLSALPTIETLRRLSQSLAMLDAIIVRDWDYRYYSFNSKWLTVNRWHPCGPVRAMNGFAASAFPAHS